MQNKSLRSAPVPAALHNGIGFLHNSTSLRSLAAAKPLFPFFFMFWFGSVYDDAKLIELAVPANDHVFLTNLCNNAQMNDSEAPKKKLLIRNDLKFAQGGLHLRQSLSRNRP